MNTAVQVFRIVIGMVFALTALISGGCSVFFTLGVIEDPSYWQLWAAGLVIAGVSGVIAYALLRQPKDNDPQDPPSDDDDAPRPPGTYHGH